VGVDVRLLEPAPRDLTLRLSFTNRPGQPVVTQRIRRGTTTAHIDVPLPNAHRWSLEDPFLHQVSMSLTGDGIAEDRVTTYFGMRPSR
jgi:beta-galactosidase/beta-glucuronidase